ncbi:MAG: nucleotide exchange factor GrpE [Candidatus Hodarchaeota archaeon]
MLPSDKESVNSPKKSKDNIEETNNTDDIEIEVIEFSEEDFDTRDLDSKTLSEYETKIEELQTEKDDLFDKYQRLTADFDNFRKRVAKERLEIVQRTKQSLFLAIVDVIDNFDRALGSLTDNPQIDLKNLLEGVKMIHWQLSNVLKKEGVEVEDIKPGDTFNPIKHEAVERITVSEEENVPDNSILEIFKKGYLFNSKILRAAQVKVARIEKPSGENSKTEEKKEDENIENKTKTKAKEIKEETNEK